MHGGGVDAVGFDRDRRGRKRGVDVDGVVAGLGLEDEALGGGVGQPAETGARDGGGRRGLKSFTTKAQSTQRRRERAGRRRPVCVIDSQVVFFVTFVPPVCLGG